MYDIQGKVSCMCSCRPHPEFPLQCKIISIYGVISGTLRGEISACSRADREGSECRGLAKKLCEGSAFFPFFPTAVLDPFFL